MSRNKEDQHDPTYAHRLKLAKEAEERKKNTKVLEEYTTVLPNPNAKRGGKVVRITRTSTGYKHSQFVGREHDNGCAEYVKQCKAEGKFKPFGG